jgi:hypothetical protein
MMRSLWVTLLVLAAACGAAPAAAAEHLDCMDSGYTADELAAVETYSAGFDMMTAGGPPPPPVMAAVNRRATACAQEHQWSDTAAGEARAYRLVSVIRATLQRHSPIDAAAMARLNAAIDAADHDTMVSIFAAISAAARGQGPPLSAAQARQLDAVVSAAGVEDTDLNQRFIGAWMAARVLRRESALRFARL